MRYFIFIVLIILLLAGSVQAKEKLIFSGLENSKLGLMVEEVIQKAYQNIGIKAEMKWLPGARAPTVANNGEVDGAQLRVATITQKFTNLIMIPVPVYETTIVVFTKKEHFPVHGWADLKPYRIGVPAGYTAILNHVKGFNCWEVDYTQIFKMLNTNRVDIGVVDRFNGLMTISQLGLEGIKILEPPLKSIKFYNFLHKKHTDIVPKITESLLQMQKKGEIREIWNKFELKFTRAPL